MAQGVSPGRGARKGESPIGTAEKAVAFDIDDLRRKASAGSAVAQTQLGICFLDGIDIEVNYAEALRHLSVAAKQGTSRSIVNLARMYEGGLGTEKNMAEAIRLYKSVSKVELSAQIGLGRIYSREGVSQDLDEAMHYYVLATEWGDRVANCPEIEEAREFVAEHSKQQGNSTRSPK